MKHPTVTLTASLIAPCGMNCGICRAFLRQKNPCHGCRYAGQNRPKTRLYCKLRVCKKRKGEFCCDCPEFPCARLRHLDERYRTKYGMSEINNLKYIRRNGLEKFLKKEQRKWISSKGVLCVHDRQHYKKAVPG